MTTDVYLLLQACCAGKQATDFVFTRLDSKKKIKEFCDDWLFSAGMLDWAGYCVRIAGKKKLK